MLAVASVVGLACATSCFTGTATKVIRIGVDLPLSGADGRAGTPALNGVQFFVHQHPTIDGFTVEIAPRDDAVGGLHDPAQGERNGKSLGADPPVLGGIGPFDSNRARPDIPLATVTTRARIS